MMKGMSIDQRGFFYEGSPYCPVIARHPESHEVRAIPLDLTLDSTLDWGIEPSYQENLFWQLDFGLYRKGFSWNNPVLIRALLKGIEHFIETCLMHYKKQTLGVCLYEGTLYPTSLDHLASYLQQLAIPFPDDIPLFVCFDAKGISSRAELAQYGSPTYFPYLHIGYANTTLPLGVLRGEGDKWIGKSLYEAKIGAILPQTLPTFPKNIGLIDRTFSELEEAQVGYRLVYESHLNEQWDELDYLLLFSDLMSPQGKRKIRGFYAAGGGCIVVGNPLGIPGEISLETYLAEAK